MSNSGMGFSMTCWVGLVGNKLLSQWQILFSNRLTHFKLQKSMQCHPTEMHFYFRNLIKDLQSQITFQANYYMFTLTRKSSSANFSFLWMENVAARPMQKISNLTPANHKESHKILYPKKTVQIGNRCPTPTWWLYKNHLISFPPAKCSN